MTDENLTQIGFDVDLPTVITVPPSATSVPAPPPLQAPSGAVPEVADSATLPKAKPQDPDLLSPYERAKADLGKIQRISAKALDDEMA